MSWQHWAITVWLSGNALGHLLELGNPKKDLTSKARVMTTSSFLADVLIIGFLVWGQ